MQIGITFIVSRCWLLRNW